MSERILITGAKGYIASNLILQLEKEGYDLYLLERTSSGKDTGRYHPVDIDDHASLQKAMEEAQPNVVLHLAATGFNYEKKQTIDDLINTNFIATSKLAQFCQAIPDFRKFIYLTTYMECQGYDRAIKPDDMIVPQSEYAFSKSLSTNLLVYLSKSGRMNANVLRLFSVYGLDDRPFRFIPTLFDTMINGKSTDTTSLSQKRDFVFIKDVVDAIVHTIKKNKTSDVVYNVGNGKPTPLSEVARKIMALYPNSKGRINIGAKPDRPNEAQCYFADISRTEKEFGWKPKYDLDAGLSQTSELLNRKFGRG